MNSDRWLGPDDPFSYACARCGACCKDKGIRINPYEAARLARRLGLSIAAFRERHTEDGVVLRRDPQGWCAFFRQGQGCSVHSGRPVVCRLFPLGRQITADGTVRYASPAWTPAPNGVFGSSGTVADFLTEQETGTLLAWADAYFVWFCRAETAGVDLETDYPDLLDLEGVVEAFCAREGRAPPERLEDRCALHIEILNGLLAA